VPASYLTISPLSPRAAAGGKHQFDVSRGGRAGNRRHLDRRGGRDGIRGAHSGRFRVRYGAVDGSWVSWPEQVTQPDPRIAHVYMEVVKVSLMPAGETFDGGDMNGEMQNGNSPDPAAPPDKPHSSRLFRTIRSRSIFSP